MSSLEVLTEAPPPYEERLKWFHEARFGMFIHWGLYSLLGRGEWVMFQERMHPDEYARLADQFTPEQFDANAWAALAVEAGMKYMVFTTRHHDGFCLFDSRVSDFTSVKTAAKRDFVAEFVEACRRAGLKVGLYHSVLDWRFPGYYEPDAYPESREAMVRQFHDQVKELMTNYGKIDMLWYDGDWVNHDYKTVADTGAFWRAEELNQEVRRLQPQILINNRSGTQEDLDTPEQKIEASQSGRGWESCMTMGYFAGWGYTRHNPQWKTTPQLLYALAQAAAGEGNFLLNIGPRPDGSVRTEESGPLREMGAWLRRNGEAIYGSQRCDLLGGYGGKLTPTNSWSMLGQWTRKGNTGYLIIDRWPGTEAVIPLVDTPALSARILSTGQSLEIRREYNGRLILSGMPETPPEPITVIAVEFVSEPRRMNEPRPAAWLTGKAE